ncbi:enolase C-terminal domain-like protein [Verrucomicrobium sp. BvORR034]|uniref:enolase C-terminal domain-like protein n=1 Tax=Verrucomicrobium sp. BvORR034 TaxID=1396418 RepID=UPI0006799579|nr:enolase C-terminal domain-like protein [Verrucomicrobium sp. BvORR034]
MSYYIHPYTLYSRGALNAVSQRREFHGVLTMVNGGVGCLHPWPEFGDPPIKDQLDLLRDGGTSKVIERALRMAAVDGEARRAGVSLFEGLEIPPCHYSWDQNQPSEPQMRRVVEEGWGAIKTKGWNNVGEVLRWLDSFAAKAGASTVKLRADFNSCLEPHQFRNFMEWMSPRVRTRLDFVEDPFPYDPESWEDMQRLYAVDLALDKALRGADEGFNVAVLKPGRREWREMLDGVPERVRVVMTSAMDHAIGQSFAAYEAALAWQQVGDRMDLCGLATDHLFARDSFFERLSAVGGVLTVDRAGTGLGFDEVLDKLAWLKL